jgi:HAD superfamily hydrolase (TIGR01509 family)
MDRSVLDDEREIRALLFDLGGVLIDIDFKRAFRAWAARASCDAAELEQRFVFDEAYEQHERGDLGSSDYFTTLRRCLGVRLSDDDLIAGWNDIYLGPTPGMAALLAQASQRFPLYAFTNSNPTHQSVWTVRFASELSIFRSIFVSSELGLRKPDPEAFSVVAKRIGFPASELLFFDDTPENIDGAVTAGMQAVLVGSASDVSMALLRLGLEFEA